MSFYLTQSCTPWSTIHIDIVKSTWSIQFQFDVQFQNHHRHGDESETNRGSSSQI